MPIVLDTRTATSHFPGIGRYVVNLACSLARLVEPDIDLVLLCDPSAGAANAALPELPRVFSPASPFSISQQWVVPRTLRHLGAGLYHSPYYLMPYFPCVPAVFTCHDMIPLIYPQYFSAAHRTIFRLAHALALKSSGVVLTNSYATRADLMRHFRLARQRIVVTHEAADPRFTPQPSAITDAVRRKYSLPERYVLYVGSNKPHKNLVRLVEAWDMLTAGDRTAGYGMVIAGYWDKRYPQARIRVRDLSLEYNVLFLPNVPEADIPALYSAASVFVFPSEYEGFGLPVLEAMACGVPVVCSSSSSLPEVAGEAALLVNPLDVEGLAEAMGRVIADDALKQDLRERGMAQARKFSWERTARETIAAYHSVLNEG